MTDTVVERAGIGTLGARIGAGGQANVYHAPEITLADVPGPLVFKEYKTRHVPPHGLRAIVAKRLRMDPATRQRLDQRAAWPVRVVEHEGRIAGVLLPLIPDSFFHQRVLPSGQLDRELLEVQHLFVDPDRCTRLGMPAPSYQDRVMLCRDFAAVVHLLHRNELVIGDINAKNAVFRLNVRPAIMLVDCDGIRIRGSMAVVRQLDAPDWDAPEKDVSQASDLYKFGLFVIRCLRPAEQASVNRDPGRLDGLLDAEGRQLVRAALGTSTATRPSAQSWGRYLNRLLNGTTGGRRSTPTARPVVPRDQPTGWRRDAATGNWTPVVSS
jgi:hypothetical protein